jgi:hypothetical protein
LGRAKARITVIAVVLVLLAAGGYLVWRETSGGLPTSVPSCSWPLRVRGPGTEEQAGLVRCYLRALARHDAAGLLAVADTANTPVKITRADFTHSADAAAGTATAVFTPNPNDSADVEVAISFADGAREGVSMDLANPASEHSWRLAIGTPVGSPGPPPANQSP